MSIAPKSNPKVVGPGSEFKVQDLHPVPDRVLLEGDGNEAGFMANILVMEDDIAFATELRFAREDSGHAVVTCDTGSRAYSLLDVADPPFDLLITDIYVYRDGSVDPDDGAHLLGLLQVERARGLGLPLSSMPIIVISGAVRGPGQSRLLTMATKFGATDTLQKPFHMTQLLAKVQALIGQPQAHVARGDAARPNLSQGSGSRR